ncbi:MAG: ATP-grasp domain-containing protein, partial [Leeuwenhoekiella sp.]
AGDYQESWQPAAMENHHLHAAKEIATKVTEALGGAGIWGVEFFITKDDIYFSEISPRPHDTGMVTLANTQNFNEFELHLRAILSLPIPEITLDKIGASAVILASSICKHPTFENIEVISALHNTDFRIFGKPTAIPNKRMGIVLSYDTLDGDIDLVRERAFQSAQEIKVIG